MYYLLSSSITGGREQAYTGRSVSLAQVCLSVKPLPQHRRVLYCRIVAGSSGTASTTLPFRTDIHGANAW